MTSTLVPPEITSNSTLSSSHAKQPTLVQDCCCLLRGGSGSSRSSKLGLSLGSLRRHGSSRGSDISARSVLGAGGGGRLLVEPLGGPGELGVVPWAKVAHFATTLTLAGATKLLGQVLRGNLGQEVLLVAAAKDVNLLNGDGVEETLDEAEDASKGPGSVDDVELAQALGVVVLRNLGGGLHISKDRAGVADTNTLQVHDGAARLEQVAGLARASRQARVGDLFVFADEVLEHAVLGRDLVHGVEVDLAELFNVDAAAILRPSACGRQLYRQRSLPCPSCGSIAGST